MATYLMADIHGHRDLFHKMLEEIAFSEQDTLYILGDVTDRGPEGIELLMEIMDVPNIVFLMGNHEDLLLRYIWLYGYGVDLRAWELLGGRPTLAGYAALTEAQQQKLEAFLENAPSHALVAADRQEFYLVHAFPSDSRQEELWGRPGRDTPDPQPHYRVIVGHTPTIYFDRTEKAAERRERELFRQGKHMKIFHGPSFIGIDCGCGTSDRTGALACLRLEDMAEFYVTKATY